MASRSAVPSSAGAALWCCLAAGFATLLDATTIAFTAGSVQNSLGASTAGVQWFLAAYSLTFGLGLVPAGRLGDAFGRRGLLIGGLAVFVLGALLSALAPDVSLLVAGRLAQGLGAGVISAQVLGIIQDSFAGRARIAALGAYSAAGAVAAVVGPLMAGVVLWLLPADLGWRIVLLSPAPFAAVAVVMAARALPRAVDVHRPGPLDLPGIALLGAIVVLLTIPVIDPGIPAAAAIALFSATAVLIGILLVWERRSARRDRRPLFAPALMRARGFVTGNLIALLWFGSLIAFSTATTVFFLQALGLPALLLALTFVPGSAARFLASRSAARLYDALGARLVPLGLLVEAVCLLLVLAATWLDDLWLLLGAVAGLQVLLGLSGGVIEPPLRAITLSAAPPGMHGVAASFLQLTQRLSATFFVAASTGILLGAVGAASTESLRGAVLLCALALVVAFIAASTPSFRSARS